MEIKIAGAWTTAKSLMFRSANAGSELELGHVSTAGNWHRGPCPKGSSPEVTLRAFASMQPYMAIRQLQTDLDGLADAVAADRLKIKGLNLLSSRKPPSWWMLLLSVIPNPFNLLLSLIAIISVVTPGPSWSTFVLLVVMIVVSCGVRFWQEYRSSVAAIKLQAGVSTDVRVRRRFDDKWVEYTTVEAKNLVPGDILLVDPGDLIPADCLVLETTNLQVSQSSLTGESEGQRKSNRPRDANKPGAIFELENILFMGTSAISGSAVALVVRTGNDAFIATIMKELNKTRPLNSFQRGIRRVSYLMIGFMLITVPIVLVVSGKTTGNWGEAALFGVSVAVGLVPEMLPAIVNANLARGAFLLAKKKAIVKRLDSIQNVGGMSVLCSDKTGTLTKDEIALCHHVDSSGHQQYKIHQLAYINATNQSGKKNSIDTAIIRSATAYDEDLISMGQKVAEIPFNFEVRRSSCIISTPTNKLLLICKGAFEEVFSLCTKISHEGQVIDFDITHRLKLSKMAACYNDDGYRVLAVATRVLSEHKLEDPNVIGALDTNMTLEGLLTFLDPPKDDAADSIQRLQAHGVEIKILTGDNLGVALKVCRTLHLAREVDEGEVQSITGLDLAELEGTEDFHRVAKSCKVFAKLTPSQKGQVIMSLKKTGEVVGMLGDGINDCVALRYADVGISVHSAASVAKDCADIILTEKQLSIIVDGVITGRVIHGNTIKYIKMVASSNFGNIFSILIASCWLPFDPMTGLQILIQNLLYDISQIAIPWDYMDPEYLEVPQRWDIKDLFRFMLVFGPTSSSIDMATFSLNWFYYGIQTADSTVGGTAAGHGVKVFHTHWFLQGLLTQTVIVHLLRTSKVPVFQSRAAKVLVASTVAMMAVGLVIPYIPPIRDALLMATPASSFIGFLAAELVFYCVEVQLVKMVYIRLFGRWL